MNKISFQRIQLASSECCAERTTLGVALRMAYHSICFMPCLRRPITNNLDKNKRHYAMLPRLLREQHLDTCCLPVQSGHLSFDQSTGERQPLHRHRDNVCIAVTLQCTATVRHSSLWTLHVIMFDPVDGQMGLTLAYRMLLPVENFHSLCWQSPSHGHSPLLTQDNAANLHTAAQLDDSCFVCYTLTIRFTPVLNDDQSTVITSQQPQYITERLYITQVMKRSC